jgi:dihydropteroate synthase
MTETYFLPRRLIGGDDAERAIASGEALWLAGGPLAFTHVEILRRAAPDDRAYLFSVNGLEVNSDISEERWRAWCELVSAPRQPLAGLDLGAPLLMGIVNVTPDSFSDGGLHAEPEAALAHARTLIAEGADILDIGGESTRPGAMPTSLEQERARALPVIQALAAETTTPLSVDTRKARIMREAAGAGVAMVNDVSALCSDTDALPAVAETGVAVVLMHMQGEPATMQDDPRYDDVLLDVYDHLAARVAACVAAGIPRGRIAVDPGIGFGKTFAHNMRLMRNLALFHGLGCAVLLGASRKGFLGRLAGGAPADQRLPASLAAVLAGRRQGVQMFRVHDVGATRQALAVWRATRE